MLTGEKTDIQKNFKLSEVTNFLFSRVLQELTEYELKVVSCSDLISIAFKTHSLVQRRDFRNFQKFHRILLSWLEDDTSDSRC